MFVWKPLRFRHTFAYVGHMVIAFHSNLYNDTYVQLPEYDVDALPV